MQNFVIALLQNYFSRITFALNKSKIDSELLLSAKL